MQDFRFFSWALLFFVACDCFAATDYSHLNKGVNAWGLFTKPTESGKGYAPQPFGGYEPKFELTDFKRVKGQGFDFVRLPVDPAPFLSRPDEQWGPLLSLLGGAVDAGLDEGLTVIVDLHSRVSDPEYSVDEVVKSFEDESKKSISDKYLRLNAVIASMLEGKNPYKTLLEPFNEPGVECNVLASGGIVNAFNEVAKVVRKNSKTIRLVFDPNCQASWRSLLGMSAFSVRDKNVVFSFHFYDPFFFTHQGSFWSKKNQFLKYLKGYPYPYDEKLALNAIEDIEKNSTLPSVLGESLMRKLKVKSRSVDDKSSIDAVFQSLSNWARVNGINSSRILLGEFGTLKPSEASGPNEKDRSMWLRDVRMAAEKHGFGWAVWEYVDVMGVTRSSSDRTLIPSVQKALELREGF